MSADTKEITITEEQTEVDLDTPWNVIVYDDPVNLMSFVTLVIQRVFGYPKTKAETMMMEVHQKGQSVVWTGQREQAELYVQQLQSHQLLAAMKKSE
ncbi:MAG: ATP-dependent Clp protease adapter ClpS [Verrucomicrobiota bacterium]